MLGGSILGEYLPLPKGTGAAIGGAIGYASSRAKRELVDFTFNQAKRVWEDGVGWVYRSLDGSVAGKTLEELWQNTQARVRGIQSMATGEGLTQAGTSMKTGGGTVQGTLFPIEDYLGPLDPSSKAAAIRFNEYTANKSGYAGMAQFKREVLNRWPKKYQDQIFRELWQNRQYEGYIEHLVAKGSHMDWYWNLKGKDRNAVENVRILFNDRVKNMKDTVEKIVYGTPQNPGLGWQSPNLSDRLIVSFEDPMKRFKTFKRQNPGDVIIMRAGSNKIIGNLGQYLDVLYPQDALGKQLLEQGSRQLGFNNVAAFRNKILSDRINIIIRDAPLLKGTAAQRKAIIKTNIDEDMANLIAEYPFLQPPPAIRRQIN